MRDASKLQTNPTLRQSLRNDADHEARAAGAPPASILDHMPLMQEKILTLRVLGGAPGR